MSEASDGFDLNEDLAQVGESDEFVRLSKLTEEQFREVMSQRAQAKLVRCNLLSESCSRKTLGLERYSSRSKFAHKGRKTAAELLLNPFGDPWSSRSSEGAQVPVATTSCIGLTRREYGSRYELLNSPPAQPSQETRDYVNYTGRSRSRYHYDETIGRLSANMQLMKSVKELFYRHGLKKNFIGYTVVNYHDGQLFSPHEELPEHFYVHKPDHSTRREDRLYFRDGSTLIAGGEIFDIRNPEVRTKIAETVAERAAGSGLKGVLIDYAVRRFAFGAPELVFDMPDDWFEDFQKCQLALMQEIYEMMQSRGLELYLNGMMLDSIVVTEPELINAYIKYCDGIFWEQPFRWEWRDYQKDGVDYYNRLQQFMDVAMLWKRRVFFKLGSYRFYGTEDVYSGWNDRFIHADWGIERHLAKYSYCMYLMYYHRYFTPMIYTHPSALWDIFCSEPYFNFWDYPIGDALGPRETISQHVLMRAFDDVIVLVNNTLKPAWVKVPIPESWGWMSQPRIRLQPLEGKFVFRRSPPTLIGAQFSERFHMMRERLRGAAKRVTGAFGSKR